VVATTGALEITGAASSTFPPPLIALVTLAKTKSPVYPPKIAMATAVSRKWPTKVREFGILQKKSKTRVTYVGDPWESSLGRPYQRLPIVVRELLPYYVVVFVAWR
jgi:hypothetical protein